MNAPAATAIVWFRDDLRLSDHAALIAARDAGATLICLYVLDDTETGKHGPRSLGAAAQWWLANSLRALDTDLKKLGQHLVLRRGDAHEVLPKLAREANAKAVFWIDSEVSAEAARARDVAEALKEIGVEVHVSASDLLASPQSIRNKEGHGLRVFTPFWKRVRAQGEPPRPLAAVRKLPPPVVSLKSENLEDWQLEPTRPDWAGGFRETWTPGEAGAHRRLHDFLDGAIKGYAEGRDFPGKDHASHLSPHLRFGEISPRQVFHAARFAAERHPALSRDIEKFLSELGWREFCRHLLFDHPDLHRHNLQSSFDDFPWRRDAKALRAWQQGRTGYPIVDAGMRELWHTGAMQNRIRMVTASFLVKHLLLDWRDGEQWFWDTLVDADPGSNPGNWQWVAGCGADAAPYFRIFNPILQGEKFDPDGAYVARWVPELSKLPPALIHKPWEATPMELAAAGVTLGKTYPEPIVDHKDARERALAAYRRTRR
ncbi:deoxyribodipyrimidine photo-lyase [Afipia sp. 1NLS2]|uniref:cryptochrome/photolyase family protein n=1 Tax=Afipia sp. 1NLS2 TaxID=666684 RepID=UPI0001D9FA20|nr:deoxyribodipyrimidine photo-lyase [Afipia sp. 1NLS2]EFI50380.1 DNA photolyase FAD-binding [Afipia sp. 1NLS2]